MFLCYSIPPPLSLSLLLFLSLSLPLSFSLFISPTLSLRSFIHPLSSLFSHRLTLWMLSFNKTCALIQLLLHFTFSSGILISFKSHFIVYPCIQSFTRHQKLCVMTKKSCIVYIQTRAYILCIRWKSKKHWGKSYSLHHYFVFYVYR